ncbi:MAG: hypothetical protein ISS28_06405 [Candidatus Cloacimonetes bacterium]|nr:hypothetical protein [Candidatus Cloacimonadota bacterium]MBL7086711.1 hypothetical protein [Candidatus Cloacimonadota bacterium]
MEKKYINLCFKYLLVFAMTLILVSCFIPEEFTIKIEVNNDGSYSFIYDGILTYLFARAAAIEAPLSEEDEAEMKEIENEFKEEPEFKKVNYIGKGQFEVLYEKTGEAGESFYFFDEQYSFFSIVYSKNDTIEISGFQLDKESLAQMEQMQLKIDGEFEILTNATVLKHNSNAKVEKIKSMDCYKWDVKSNLEPAPYMLLTYQKIKVEETTD